MISRRETLAGLGATLAALTLGPLSRWGQAQSTGAPRFVFVFNYGGWDPTHTFATTFGSPNIDMEPGASLSTAGNLSFVDHPDRPSVRSFMQRYGSKTLLINGMNVPSLAHEVCASLALTGSSGIEDPDWATRVAFAARDGFTLPHLVLSGLAFPANLGTAVARVGTSSQLEQLLSGVLLDRSDLPTGRPDALRERILDDYMSRRTAAAQAARHGSLSPKLFEDLHTSTERARALKDSQYDMDFSPGNGLSAQLRTAVDALSLGLSRCVTLASGSGQWDTHGDNSPQSTLWEGLFAGLLGLQAQLESTPGPTGLPLSEDTVLVVLSEMGRTPKLNASGGRDHWPYTSMMVVGPGVTGDRVIGGFDDSYYGLGVDRTSGEVDVGSPALHPEAVGAALLQLAGLDPAESMPDVVPLGGMLA